MKTENLIRQIIKEATIELYPEYEKKLKAFDKKYATESEKLESNHKRKISDIKKKNEESLEAIKKYYTIPSVFFVEIEGIKKLHPNLHGTKLDVHEIKEDLTPEQEEDFDYHELRIKAHYNTAQKLSNDINLFYRRSLNELSELLKEVLNISNSYLMFEDNLKDTKIHFSIFTPKKVYNNEYEIGLKNTLQQVKNIIKEINNE